MASPIVPQSSRWEDVAGAYARRAFIIKAAKLDLPDCPLRSLMPAHHQSGRGNKCAM